VLKPSRSGFACSVVFVMSKERTGILLSCRAKPRHL
jgi:hypothetical protein